MAIISPGASSRTRSNDLPGDLGAGRAIPLFGLPPGGVCRAGPVARAAVDLVLATAFLVEFLSAGHYHPLSALTNAPRRQALPVDGAAVDRWGDGGVPLVLVHGYAPAGKDEPRVQEAAALLARAGIRTRVARRPPWRLVAAWRTAGTGDRP